MVNYFSFSIKNLKRRGVRSWLTLLGIFIGIIAVVSLITLGDGLKAAVNAQFGVSSTEIISVQAGGINYGSPGSTVVNSLTRADSDAIGRLSTIEFSIPRNIEFIKREYNDRLSFGYAVNIIDGLEEETYEAIGLEAESGRLLKTGDLGRIVIGNNLADEKKNGFGKDLGVGKSILVEGVKFSIIGVLKREGSFIFDNIILMYDSDLDALVDYGDNVDVIAVKVKGKEFMDKAKEDIEKLLRDRRGVKKGEEDFEVSTPEAALGQINSVLNAIQIFVVLIASISIFIGTLGVINTMATSVVERRKEIGIMKSIGARNFHIFLMFLIESGLMGFVGGLIGVIFGLAIGYYGIVAINDFVGVTSNFSFDFMLISFTLIGSFVIGALAGIIPAMNAARQNPVEVLRG